jgi:hypothetical protein
MSALVFYKVSFQPFEEFFCQTWAFCGFRTQWFSSGKYKTYFYTNAVLESFLALPIGTRKSFLLDNQYRRVPFSTKLIGLNVV